MALRLPQAPVSAPSHQWSITDTAATFGVTACHHCAICESITLHPQTASSAWLCWDVTKTLPALYLSAPGWPGKQVSEKELSLLLHQPEAAPLARQGFCLLPWTLHISVREPQPQPSSWPVLAGGATPGKGPM